MHADNQPQGERTYHRLKAMILSGEIGLGEPLIERQIAEKLGVSRTPVRETIAMLGREGLVRLVEGKGAFVASFTVEDMIEIYHVREGLEPIAARLACQHIPRAELDHFESELGRLSARPSLRIEKPEDWMRVGRDFHEMFIRASNNSRLIGTISGFQDQIDLARGFGRFVATNESDSAIVEHLRILRALQAGDPAEAEAAVRDHLRSGLQHRLARFASGRGPAGLSVPIATRE